MEYTTTCIEVTLKPAIRRFREIANIFFDDAQPLPVDVVDGWEQLTRIRDWADWELRVGKWRD